MTPTHYTAEDIEQITAETRSKLAERLVLQHLDTWDYSDVRLMVHVQPYGYDVVSYDHAVRECEWEALRDYHLDQANRTRDCEDKRMHLQIAAAMREMEAA